MLNTNNNHLVWENVRDRAIGALVVVNYLITLSNTNERIVFVKSDLGFEKKTPYFISGTFLLNS